MPLLLIGQHMNHNFDIVEQKISETEFFLRKMVEAGADYFAFQCFLSAYLAAARTSTLALQQFKHLDGFHDWYVKHQQRLKSNQLAKFFLDLRNEHLHGGPYPVAGGMFSNGKATYHFPKSGKSSDFQPADIVAACRNYFIGILEVIYDCYLVLGTQIDPQQHYTKEHFATQGRTIDDAEIEVCGWICTSFIEEGLEVDDRWRELRGQVGECTINHLFNSYLGRVTPQPNEPEHYRDFDFTPEERGWIHVPAGYSSIEEYLGKLGAKAA